MHLEGDEPESDLQAAVGGRALSRGNSKIFSQSGIREMRDVPVWRVRRKRKQV